MRMPEPIDRGPKPLPTEAHRYTSETWRFGFGWHDGNFEINLGRTILVFDRTEPDRG